MTIEVLDENSTSCLKYFAAPKLHRSPVPGTIACWISAEQKNSQLGLQAEVVVHDMHQDPGSLVREYLPPQ